MYKFFEGDREEGYIRLSKENLKHMKVLRIRDDEEFEIVTSQGKFICLKDQERAKILRENFTSTESPIKLKLFMGICKFDKMELILKAATEIGISDFYPLEMRRSTASYRGKEDKKLARLEEIALSAAKQSKRDIVPRVHFPLEIKELKNHCDQNLIVAYENEENNFVGSLKPSKNVSLIVGPEGGFDDEEIGILRELNPSFISLGNRILRAETAALAASFFIIHNWEREFEEI